MAKPVCTMCSTYEGVLMHTNLVDGDTVVVCATDLLSFAIGMAAELTSEISTEQVQEYLSTLIQIAVNAGLMDPPGPEGVYDAADYPQEPIFDDVALGTE